MIFAVISWKAGVLVSSCKGIRMSLSWASTCDNFAPKEIFRILRYESLLTFPLFSRLPIVYAKTPENLEAFFIIIDSRWGECSRLDRLKPYVLRKIFKRAGLFNNNFDLKNIQQFCEILYKCSTIVLERRFIWLRQYNNVFSLYCCSVA